MLLVYLYLFINIGVNISLFRVVHFEYCRIAICCVVCVLSPDPQDCLAVIFNQLAASVW